MRQHNGRPHLARQIQHSSELMIHRLKLKEEESNRRWQRGSMIGLSIYLLANVVYIMFSTGVL